MLCLSLRSAEVQHEVEATLLTLRALGDLHQQLAPEQEIQAVAAFAGKIQLGREHRTAGRLHLEVVVPSAGNEFPGTIVSKR